MLFEIVFGWTILVVLVEAVSLVDTLKFKKKLVMISNKYNYNYIPSVSVIVPFKGLDPGLEENIKSIINQDYPHKEYIFIIDNYKDAAYGVLKKFNKQVKIILSKKIKTCSGKIAALITASKTAEGDVLVFADSDIRPGRNWLRELVKPLKDEGVGASTGYRWYFPTDNKFSSYLRSAWSSIGFWSMLSKYTFVWGGSFAITRKKFNEMNIISRWKTAISDDTEVTKACKEFGYKIQFVPKSVVGSFENCSWSQLKEFSNRQTWFVRNYDKKAWRVGMFSQSALNLMLLTGILFIVFSFWKSYILIPGIIIVCLQILLPIKAYVKQKNLEYILPHYKSYFKQGRLKSAVAKTLVRPLSNYNLIKTKYMKRIEWRGRKYS